MNGKLWMAALGLLALGSGGSPARAELPAIDAELTFAPQVPAPIKRSKPALVRVALETTEEEGLLMEGFEKGTSYRFWTFNGRVPGPFIRTRVDDVLEVRLKNSNASLMPHNVDFHAVTGPGGGGKVTMAKPGEEKVARFKMLQPGLYVYHCAAPPVSAHIANGMYGLILVEPAQGLAPVDREYYVMQSEFYTTGPFGAEGLQNYDAEKGLAERPTYVVFNGKVGALQNKNALQAKVGERVRFYFGNGGPNLVSSWHVIGAIFDKVYEEGSLITPPLSGVQTTLVPAGGSSVVETKLEVPGDYTLVDHSIFRIEKGAVGTLRVEGPENKDIYQMVK